MFWPCYIINLKENQQRLRNCEKQFLDLGLDFQIIDAVNGRNLSQEEIDTVYDSKKNKLHYKASLVASEIGCYLSHYKAWKEIANGPKEGGFVFEDDFKAADDLVNVIKALSEDSMDDWDMVKLFSLDKNPKILSSRIIAKDLKIVQPYKIPTCLIGYALTKKGARKLISRHSRIFRPVDEDLKYFWETGLRVSLIVPSPVSIGDQTVSVSTIGNDRKLAGRKLGRLNIKKFLRGIFYRFRYQFLLLYHNKIR
jgi:glycosyl transferase family 25